MALTVYGPFDVSDMARLGNHAAVGLEGTADAAARAPFADPAGTPTDPDAVWLTVLLPNGAGEEYGWPTAGATGALTRESAGRFYVDRELSVAGLWEVWLRGTGAVQAATGWRVYVQPRNVPSAPAPALRGLTAAGIGSSTAP